MTDIIPSAPFSFGRRPGGFRALVCTQFLGVFNDNLYKMVVSLLAVDAAIVAAGSSYLSLTGAAFVLPYILFAGYAGYVADRFDKRRVLIATKLLELGVMALALLALLSGRFDFLVATLALLAMQATFFSPAKYGIIPETLPASALMPANGMMEFGRYSAIILGTAAGGILIETSRHVPALIGAVLIAIAATGVLASLRIDQGTPVPATRRFPINPWRDVIWGVRRLCAHPTLAVVVSGITAFELLCTLVMLDMILFAKTLLGLDDLRIGLLGAGIGIGAGIGCVTAGWLSRDRIEAGLAILGTAGVGLMLALVGQLVASFGAALVVLTLLGLCAGFIMVPLNALLQLTAAADERGRMIATNNFLNMAGCLTASALLWLLHDAYGIAPDAILVLCGFASLALAALAFACLPDLALRALRLFIDIWHDPPQRCRVS